MALPTPIFHLVNSENRDELQASLVAQTVKNARNWGSIPGSGIFPGEGNSYRLQYSCLENPIDRGAWQATIQWGHKELDNTEWLRHFAGFWRCFKHHVLRIIPVNSFWSSSCFEPKCQLRLSLAIQMKRLEFHSVYREFFIFSNLWREFKGERRWGSFKTSSTVSKSSIAPM